MKDRAEVPYRFTSLSDLHRVLGLPKPLHPLISFIANTQNTISGEQLPPAFLLDFYKIAYEPHLTGKFKYGQQVYDFAEGGLCFSAPNQVRGFAKEHGDHTGYALFIHPDFFRPYPLAKKIRQYGFFSYAQTEALHVSHKEKKTILALFKMIDNELKGSIDDFSQDVLICQLELLLTQISRFYKRQFLTRKVVNNDILHQLEAVLDTYFNDETLCEQGMLTVAFLAEQVHLSAGYLSDLLRASLGLNAQQYIHEKLIEKAKEKLAFTPLSISEIAYTLGFEYSQSFSKLFKKKTSLSPVEFRRSLN